MLLYWSEDSDEITYSILVGSSIICIFAEITLSLRQGLPRVVPRMTIRVVMKQSSKGINIRHCHQVVINQQKLKPKHVILGQHFRSYRGGPRVAPPDPRSSGRESRQEFDFLGRGSDKEPCQARGSGTGNRLGGGCFCRSPTA